MFIFPYRYRGGWVFDDERYGLVREALVDGADTLLDKLCAPYEGGGKVVTQGVLRFAELGEHGGGPYTLIRSGPRNNGNDYVVDGPGGHLSGHRVWLCSALDCYFAAPPGSISFAFGPSAFGLAEDLSGASEQLSGEPAG
jgi:hypothetical protein